MNDSGASELLDKVNFLIGKISCLEIDTKDLIARVEQQEKQVENLRFGNEMVKTPQEVNPTNLLNVTDNLEDSINILIIRVGELEVKHLNLRCKVEILEKKIENIRLKIRKRPQVPPKPANLNLKQQTKDKSKSDPKDDYSEQANYSTISTTNNVKDNSKKNYNNNSVGDKAQTCSNWDISQSKEHESNISETDKSQEKEKDKMSWILNELVNSERDYINQLESIKQGYIVRLKSEPGDGSDWSELKSKVVDIFGNFEEIHNFHKNIFIDELEKSISHDSMNILQCFAKRKDDLYQLYSSYCQNFKKKMTLREKIKDHYFLKICQDNLGHLLPLETYLIKPVQRITKYQLLIEGLLNCSDDKQLTNDLQQARECISSVLNRINDHMPTLSVDNYSYNSGLGEVLLEGDFLVKYKKPKDLLQKKTKRHIYLYQNALMFCKCDMKSFKNRNCSDHLIMMNEISCVNNNKEDCKSFNIELVGKKKVYTIEAVNEKQRTDWVDQIQLLLDKVKLNRSSVQDDFSDSSDEDFILDIEKSPSCQVYIVGNSYEASKECELTIKKGNLVYLISEENPDWWFVRLYGVEKIKKEGLVPAENLKLYTRSSFIDSFSNSSMSET